MSSALASLDALSHETRLRAFRALVQAGPTGLAGGALRDRLEVPPPTLTAHLNLLRAAGLVQDQREGRSIRVRADFARMNALLAFLAENCCGGASCDPAPSGKPRRKGARR